MPPQQRPASQDDMSLGEVARMIEALRIDTTDRFDRIDAKFDRIDSTYVRREMYDALERTTSVQIDGIRSDVAKLQNAQSWLIRTLGGAVIVGLVGAFLAAAKFVGS